MADKETVVTLKTNRGDIALRFFPGTAPEHVKNFIWHAENTYPGCTFHRVIPGFMIQGGDPNTKPGAKGIPGTGGHSYKGPGTSLPAEFNDRHHTRGILSMARSRDPDSAGSQFFIMHGDAPFLDGKYTVFGETIDGIEVVDAIVNTPRNDRDRPNEDQKILEVKIEDWPTSKVEETKAAMWAADGDKDK
ncbi:MAG: peptidylprolyl isomerase [Candidatus Latescibacteria bacterium]|nr:peptidylprolyl isomerase [Candidatus Latescibacterota bacterium]